VEQLMARPTKSTQQMHLKEQIKDMAWQQMRDVAAAELSLRAIARALSLSAPAIYHHYADRDALVTALIMDAYTSLGDHQMAARETVTADDLQRRLRVTITAYRAWAIEMPQRYQLIFGTPIPGYHAPAEIQQVAGRSLRALVSIIDQLSATHMLNTVGLPIVTPAAAPMFDEWRQKTEASSAAALTVAIMIWGRVHGLVSLELAGSIPPHGRENDGLFTYELDAIERQFITSHTSESINAASNVRLPDMSTQ
jgi:AcrR family transcriptional regulator